MRIDVGAREKCEHDRADAGDVTDPGRERHPDRITCDGSDNNFEQGGRDRDPKRSERGNERQCHPEGRLQPNIIHYRHPYFVPGDEAQKNPHCGGSDRLSPPRLR
jgi:hypothetical protein